MSPRRPALEPMFATLSSEAPAGTGWIFEPKYDGVRVLAFVTPAAVKLITRNHKDKGKQFPEIADELVALAKKTRRAFVLDGEIVAIEGKAFARFQALQSRMHVQDRVEIAEHAIVTPSALVVFDILIDGDDTLVDDPWTVRRDHLVKLLALRQTTHIRISEILTGKPDAILKRARSRKWEGVIAKRADSIYELGTRSKRWLKVKVENRQEFVVGGYTEPRNTRQHIGALLLGYYDGDELVYVGHTGGGFTQKELARVHKLLKPLERRRSPFSIPPRTNARAHWVEPEIVVEVKFSEWTGDGRLRQPIYLGTRDDKKARDVGHAA